MLAAAFPSATTFYLALFTSDPTTVGTTGEVTGGSYSRQAVTFTAPSGGTTASTGALSFPNMPAEAGGINFFGIFSAPTGGTYEGGGTTTGLSSAIPSGATVNFAAGQVSLNVA